MRSFYFLFFVFLVGFKANAQNPIGLSQITNFSKTDYRGGNQNWDIQQDKFGIMYFANNEGLLTYNGENWKIYTTPNKTVVRSVQIAPDGKIYVGAQDEIGYFYPDETGILKYTSLKNLIPVAQRSFSDVWNVVIWNGRIFFRTSTEIMELQNGTITCFKSKTDWLYLCNANNQLFAQERTTALMELKDNRWAFVCEMPKNATVTSIVPYSKDTLLISTLKDGLFLLNNNKLIRKKTDLDNIFSNIRINAVQLINQDMYAIGSGFNGCYIINHAGNVIQNFSDLQSKYVRSLFLDQDKNIWLGLDDGISFIAYNSAIKQIYPDQNKQSATYAVRVFNKLLYVGTSDAVFSMPLKDTLGDLSYRNGTFSEVQNTKSQVWNLNIVNNHLLLGNEEGAYAIEKNTASQIFAFPGTWIFKPLAKNGLSESILTGTYEGISLIKFSNNRFVNLGRYSGLFESLRFLTIDYDKNIVWASHPYRGVYKIQLSTDKSKISHLMLCSQMEGLPSSLHNYVFKIKGRNIVATQNGIYEYDYSKSRFFLSPYFYPMFKNTELQYLNEDNDGNIWFIGNKRVGVVDFSKKSDNKEFSVVYFPELTPKVLAGFENVYAYNKQNIFIGSNKGVVHLNYEKYLKNEKQLNVLLGQVKIIGEKDSTIFGGYFKSNNIIQGFQGKESVSSLPNSFNSFNFQFSSTLFEQHSNIEYSYQLEGFDKKWSAWNSKSEKEYTNLGYGFYTFKVKARNNLGNESDYVSYSFEIKPAWYQTYWSYAFYVLLALGFIYGIVKFQQRKHKKAQIDLKYRHQLELERSEKEIVSLKNEKLETEVNHKNKELATATMHLVQRGKLLSKIKEGLLPLIDEKKPAENHAELLKVLKLINEAERNDSDWENFAIHFDKIHSNFLDTLKTKFPELSPTDLKMCAYLKINLASKEIAQLMSITVRAVEVGRYRLRKKLNLPSNVNLFDYLVKVTTKPEQNS